MNENNKIGSLRTGNELNMEKIIKQYSQYLLKVITNICGNYLTMEDKEEVILDVFLAIWKNTAKLNDQKEIKPYLASIAHNLTKKKMSKNCGKVDFVDYDENLNITVDNLDFVFENNRKTKELNYILKDFSQEDYSIFTMFYYFSKKAKEIAKELDISEAKVKTKLCRIRKRIKKKLKERGIAYE